MNVCYCMVAYVATILVQCDPLNTCMTTKKHSQKSTSVTWNAGFPGGASGKEPTCQCRRRERPGLDPGWGRSFEGGRSNSLQYSCLENPMNRGLWWATVHRVAKSWTWLKQLSTHTVKCVGSKLTMPACLLSHFSCVRLSVTLWAVARQAPLSMGILQARILDWVALPSSREFSWPRDWTHVSGISMSPALAGVFFFFFTTSTTWVNLL